MKLDKVIIWGHELHNHTHSYIHNAFYITFKHLEYKTYWYNEDGENNYPENGILDNFENSLFIVHGLESKNLPLNNTSIYISHNVEWFGNEFKIPKNHLLKNKTDGIPCSNILSMQVLTTPSKQFKSYKNINHHKYTDDCIFLPWATDLLPHEIDMNIENLNNIRSKNISNFIGMPIDPWYIFHQECKKNGIQYKNYGGTFDKDSHINKSVKENMELIQESIIAPALQEPWQLKNEYIPCRIFKNISYGKMGITNNKAVNELFNNKLIYSEDIDELVKQGLEFEKRDDKLDIIRELMIEVRDNHTYINRINFILDFLKEFKNTEVKNS